MVVLLALLLLAPAGPGAAVDRSCTSCHTAIASAGKPHAPLKDGSCSTCHVPASAGTPGKCKSPEASAWTLTAAQPALCTKCHDVSGSAPQHKVIATQGCTTCHDPHASRNQALLKQWPVEQQCYRCHAKFDDAAHVHTAVRQGKCLGCHDPHAGAAAPLLVDEKPALCLSCHKLETLAKKHVKHPPVLEGRCLDCHDPHRSDHPAQLVEAGKALCLTCHDAKKPPAKGAPKRRFQLDLALKNVHKPVRSGDCQDCHVQEHASDVRALLKQPVAATCYRCHPRLDDQKFTHGAVLVGDCAVCHDPHASQNPGLLRTAKKQDLCFQCHEDDLTGRAHIHTPVKDGNCTKCHEPHGGDYPFDLVQGEGKQACLSCHKGVGETKVKHLALERYGCTICHDPHATANTAQLVKPVNALCTSCHAAQENPAHVGSFVAGGHKLEGGPDPHDPQRDFSCASCHKPHGSDNPRLFAFGKDAMESCAYCHGDKTGKHPELEDVSRVRQPQTVPASAAPPHPPEVKP